MAQSQNSAIGRLIVAASLISVIADQSNDGNVRFRPAINSVHTVEDLDVKDHAFVKANCRHGIPVKQPKAAQFLGPTSVVVRETYVLEHSADCKTPYWVSERLTAADLTGPDQGRLKPEPFRPEPWVNKGARAELKDYAGSGYARGHMMPDADRSDNRLKAETYFLSNMVPQFGPFNSGVWLKLEKHVRAWACTRDEVLIITGPVWYDPKEADPSTADGQVSYSVIGSNQVAVPTHLFKIVLSRNPDTDKLESLAFLFPNQPKFPKSPPLEDYLTTIDFIELQTGFDFFPELKKAEQDKLEAFKATALWARSDECK
jgi:endonuclease G